MVVSRSRSTRIAVTKLCFSLIQNYARIHHTTVPREASACRSINVSLHKICYTPPCYGRQSILTEFSYSKGVRYVRSEYRNWGLASVLGFNFDIQIWPKMCDRTKATFRLNFNNYLSKDIHLVDNERKVSDFDINAYFPRCHKCFLNLTFLIWNN
jgi:hypothetical protein